jgi:hypothetical protein
MGTEYRLLGIGLTSGFRVPDDTEFGCWLAVGLRLMLCAPVGGGIRRRTVMLQMSAP